MAHNMLSAINITPEQRRIIEYPLDKHDLYVEAPAGHGKTSTAMLKAGEIAKSLADEPKKQVLILTFSKMAVRQIDYEKRQQVQKPLHSKILIQTYHAFYFDLIRHYARYLGFEHSEFSLLTREERKALYLLFDVTHPGLDFQSFSYSQYLNSGICAPEPVAEDMPHELINPAATFFENYHKQEQRLGFEDYPYYVYRILADSSFVCNLLSYKYPVIFLDEFQNTNDLQWTILKCFNSNLRLVVFADPNQTIHGFRGAGHVIDQFKKERKPHSIPLTTNFRNSSSLYAFAKGIATGKFDGPPPKNVSFHKMEIYKKDKWSLKFDILKAFKRSIRSIAVLTKENKEVAAISDLLSRKTTKTPVIPHEVVTSDFSKQDRENVVLALFQLLTTCDIRYLIGVASTLSACAGGNANYLYYLKQAIEEGKCTPQSIASNKNVPGSKNARVVLKSIRPFLEANRPKSPEEVWKRMELVLDGLGKIQSIPNLENSYKRLRSAWELFLCQQGEINFETYMHRILSQRRRQNFLEQRSYLKGVFVMTLHQSQGKQFDAVLIWRCNEGIIPHYNEIQNDDCEPSQYLLYVGVTRARHEVHFYYEQNEYYQPSRLIQPYL
jgi:DNA helicase-2/ATP-dependent DNA helicase PcrA